MYLAVLVVGREHYIQMFYIKHNEAKFMHYSVQLRVTGWILPSSYDHYQNVLAAGQHTFDDCNRSVCGQI